MRHFRVKFVWKMLLPDCRLSGKGFMLLLDLQLGRLQAQSFPRLQFLDAAIAGPAFLDFGWQPTTTALHRVAAGKSREKGEIHFKRCLCFFLADRSCFI